MSATSNQNDNTQSIIKILIQEMNGKLPRNPLMQ